MHASHGDGSGDLRNADGAHRLHRLYLQPCMWVPVLDDRRMLAGSLAARGTQPPLPQVTKGGDAFKGSVRQWRIAAADTIPEARKVLHHNARGPSPPIVHLYGTWGVAVIVKNEEGVMGAVLIEPCPKRKGCSLR